MKRLTKVIASSLVVASIIALNPIRVSAKLSQNEAEDSIFKNGVIYYDNDNEFLKSNLEFKEEVSKDTLPEDITKEIYKFTKGNENLYEFTDANKNWYPFLWGGLYYYVGVDSGQIYVYKGERDCGRFSWIKNNKAVKSWSWEKYKKSTLTEWVYTGWNQLQGWVLGYDKNWHYYIDGVNQTGWIYDNGNWYYCYSNGQMAHDTTIDGYYLNSNGAWTN